MTCKAAVILLFLSILPASVGFCADPAVPAADKESTISVKSELNKAFITIGDPVEFTITVKHSKDIKVLSSFKAPSKDVFKVKKIDDIREEEGDLVIEGKRFTLTTFRLGEFILEPVKIEYRAGGGEVESLETNRLFLKVNSVAGGEDQTDIRGIKSVLNIPANVLIPAGIGGGVFLLILIPLLFRWLRKRPAVEAPVERLLSAEEEAFLHLNQLFDSDLLARGAVKEYYLQFSEIIRIYLERRYSIQAVESTTFEIIRFLKESVPSTSLRGLIKEVLEFADLAKFAKHKPEPREILEMNQKAREIIEASKPAEAGSGDGI